jgi:hypothetical protein
MVAWVDRNSGSLRLAVGASGKWRGVSPVWEPTADGTPVVACVADAWAVSWNEDVGFGRVELGVIAADGTGTPDPVLIADQAVLIGAVFTDEDLHVVWAAATGAVVGATTLAFIPIPDMPVPFPVARATTESPLSSSGSTVPSSLGGPSPISLTVATIQLHDGTRPDGSAYALVTWWPTPQELRYVELDEGGMVLPAEALQARGNATYSPALVNEAIHAVRSR